MSYRQMTIAGLAATLALGVIAAPAPAAAPSSDARAYGKHCQTQSKKRVPGSTGTPFSGCVVAMGRLARAQSRSPHSACASLSRRRAPGARRSPLQNCVAAGSKLIKNGNGIDRAYLEDMIVHHRMAVDMAQLAPTRATTQYVQSLAETIITSQQAEIGRMRTLLTRLKASGIKRVSLRLTEAEAGMADHSSHLVGANPFDVPFVEMMTPHHQGAIAMSKVVSAKGASKAVRQLAKQITTDQTREIEEMRQFRASAGGGSAAPGAAPAPTGGAPAAPGATPDPKSRKKEAFVRFWNMLPKTQGELTLVKIDTTSRR